MVLLLAVGECSPHPDALRWPRRPSPDHPTAGRLSLAQGEPRGPRRGSASASLAFPPTRPAAHCCGVTAVATEGPAWEGRGLRAPGASEGPFPAGSGAIPAPSILLVAPHPSSQEDPVHIACVAPWGFPGANFTLYQGGQVVQVLQAPAGQLGVTFNLSGAAGGATFHCRYGVLGEHGRPQLSDLSAPVRLASPGKGGGARPTTRPPLQGPAPPRTPLPVPQASRGAGQGPHRTCAPRGCAHPSSSHTQAWTRER